MKERIQGGLNLFEDHVFEFNFVNDSLLDKTNDDGSISKSKVPDELQAIINDPEKRKKLVLFINPPYGEVTVEKAKDVVALLRERMFGSRMAKNWVIQNVSYTFSSFIAYTNRFRGYHSRLLKIKESASSQIHRI